MTVFTTALLFMALAGVAFALTNRYVKRRLSKPGLASRATTGLVSISLVFAGVFFITAWGFDPAVIQINLRQTLDPFRWVNWLLSALSFGIAQAFLLELLRSRIGAERALADTPSRKQLIEQALEDVLSREQATGQPLEDVPSQKQVVGAS